MENFEISNLGPIGHVSVEFGDMTILVGPQASGKSLFLETLKLIIDRKHIISTLEKYGYFIGQKNVDRLLGVYYGDGMLNVWKEETVVRYDGCDYNRSSLTKNLQHEEDDERLFYIPAQRILGLPDGRLKNFMEFDNTSPYVLRSFTENLRLFVQHGMGNNSKMLFPIKTRLKGFTRQAFDENIFHTGQVVVEERMGQRSMFLHVDDMSLPFMSWSAGQKEFMPLLLGFYCVSGPPNRVVNKEKFKFVVVEEPEMGLHPRAIVSVILQLLELVQNGFKVVVSTHSPVFLEFAWAFHTLCGNRESRDRALCEIFHISRPDSPVAQMLSGIFDKTIRTYFFHQLPEKGGKVESADISTLNVFDNSDFVATWGGLSAFSSHVSDVISRNVIDSEA